MPSLHKRRVIVVTGSPNPHNLVAPAAIIRMPNRIKALQDLNPWRKDKRLVAEMQAKAEDHSDMRFLMEGKPLADFECSHGKLPNDANVSCQCWSLPMARLPEDLRERIREVRGVSGHVRAALSKLV